MRTEILISIVYNSDKIKDVLKIAQWERPNVKDRMTCPAVTVISLGGNEIAGSEIEKIFHMLDVSVKGTRTFLLTTIIRFILPSKAGSLDTNLVGVVGVGDVKLNHHQWLNLVIRRTGDN